MCDIGEVTHIVEELRKQMNDLLSTKKNLMDPSIITISQLLDVILVEYYKILKSIKD